MRATGQFLPSNLIVRYNKLKPFPPKKYLQIPVKIAKKNEQSTPKWPQSEHNFFFNETAENFYTKWTKYLSVLFSDWLNVANEPFIWIDRKRFGINFHVQIIKTFYNAHKKLATSRWKASGIWHQFKKLSFCIARFKNTYDAFSWVTP